MDLRKPTAMAMRDRDPRKVTLLEMPILDQAPLDLLDVYHMETTGEGPALRALFLPFIVC